MSEVAAASVRAEPHTAGLWAALPYVAWTQAVVATAGSLYFSEFMDLQPCVLCWYQRILMYPLAAVLAVGILRRDRGIAAYVLPLTLLGLAIAAYHNLLYYGVLPESAQPCRPRKRRLGCGPRGCR